MLNELVMRWQAALAACQVLGGDSRELVVAPRATESDIAEVERKLGHRLPLSLRTFFAEVSSHVEVEWFLPENQNPPFRGVFSGSFHARLSTLDQLAASHAGWLRECFSNRADPYDAVWYDKLPVLRVGNGDFIAVDTVENDGAVVYLSHDDGEGHGHTLGRNFLDFADRYSLLGCVGAEDWQWIHFWSAEHLLDGNGTNARTWRDWFGLNFVP